MANDDCGRQAPVHTATTWLDTNSTYIGSTIGGRGHGHGRTWQDTHSAPLPRFRSIRGRCPSSIAFRPRDWGGGQSKLQTMFPVKAHTAQQPAPPSLPSLTPPRSLR
ncbi:hypothetical protein P3342_011177 [Pyrenophora teres f. teres]|nr:hypothetical protein P3342_011177 [Pyrenophora teres f. teres]